MTLISVCWHLQSKRLEMKLPLLCILGLILIQFKVDCIIQEYTAFVNTQSTAHMDAKITEIDD